MRVEGSRPGTWLPAVDCDESEAFDDDRVATNVWRQARCQVTLIAAQLWVSLVLAPDELGGGFRVSKGALQEL